MPDEHQRWCSISLRRASATPYHSRTLHFVCNAAHGIEVADGVTNSTGRAMADGRLDALRRDLAARIRPLVPDLSDDEFEALIERMAQLQYKYEARRAEDFFDRSSHDEPPA